MERRGRRPPPLSPGRTKVWVEPRRRQSPSSSTPASPASAAPALAPAAAANKVPVVYYLCRNRHLEHPHFMEVPLSSPDRGLCLRDVIERLNALRGKGMARMYSWSCKRSYKNGFVWHDLSEDDIVLPVHGNEYILKGSELLDRSPKDRLLHYGANGTMESNKIQKQESRDSVGTQQDSSSASPQSPSPPVAIAVKFVNRSAPPLPQSPHSTIIREDDQCRTPRSGSSENISPEQRRNAYSSATSSPCIVDCMMFKPLGGAQDAATQTEDTKGIDGDRNCIPAKDGQSQEKLQCSDTEISLRQAETAPYSPPPTSSSASTGGRLETLESLIRAEASKRSSMRMLDEDDSFMPLSAKMRPSNLLMQLITCGSLSVKDHHRFNFLPSYKPRFTEAGVPSAFSTPGPQRDLDRVMGIPKPVGVRPEAAKFFSGSLLETKWHTDELGRAISPVKHSTSSDGERTFNMADSKGDAENVVDSGSMKCLPQTMKIISCKQSKSGTFFSPQSDAKNSSCRSECSGPSPLSSSKSTTRRIIDSSSTRGSSLRTESFHEEKVIRIEERLSSGARVIIQSAPISEDTDSSADSL